MIYLFLLSILVLLFCRLLLEENVSFIYSSSNFTSSTLVKSNDIFLHLGRIIESFLPKKLSQTLFELNLKLSRGESAFYRNLSESSCILFLCLLVAFTIKQFWFFCFGFCLAFLNIVEIYFSWSFYKKNLSKDLGHLFACITVLVVKTEIPILHALEIIHQGLPLSMRELNLELNKLINQIKSTGLKDTLSEISSEIALYQDFLMFLLACHEGTNKAILLEQISKLDDKFNEEKTLQSKNFTENIQLYLIGPVLLILFIVMMPMMSAIDFMMKSQKLF